MFKFTTILSLWAHGLTCIGCMFNIFESTVLSKLACKMAVVWKKDKKKYWCKGERGCEIKKRKRWGILNSKERREKKCEIENESEEES